MENKTYNKQLAYVLVFGLFFKIYLARVLLFRDFNIVNLFLKEAWIVLLFLLILILAKNNRRETRLYFSINLIFSIILLTVITYFNYYGNVITYKALLQFNQIGGIKLSILDLLDPIAIALFLDIFIVYFIKRKSKAVRLVSFNKLAVLGLLILALSLSTSTNKVQNTSEIVNETIKAEKMGIFNYQVYAYLSDQIITANAINTSDELIVTNKDNLNTEERNMYGISEDKNVIYIQLEALLNFTIGIKVDGQEITPNLNKLIEESIYFSNFYQQIGTGTTSDAEFVANTSIHPIGDVAMSYATKDMDLPSMVRILNEKGYETMTFHTNDVKFWDRNYLYETLGFDRYYDKEFFGEEDFISFGSSDEILYEKTIPELKRLSDQNNKLYANVISMSSHHPYSLPEEYHKIVLPEEFDNTKLGNYLISVNYADYAFGKFIDDLKANGLYEDTMLVIYGDHYALPIEDNKDSELFEKIYNRPYSDLTDKYNIPLIIHIPWENEQKTVDLVGGQVDIMPTVLNLMGINPNDYHLYGTDLLNSESNTVPIRYYVPSGSFVNNEIFYIPGESFEDGIAIDIKTGEQVEDIYQYKDDYLQVVELLQSSDNYIKTFPVVEVKE